MVMGRNPSSRFLSTLPARGATQCGKCLHRQRAGFLSTLPARGATAWSIDGNVVTIISIHAPREGSDGQAQRGQPGRKKISIHAPREGSDL